jgi:peptidoglycan/xylan/chitin deacetylase (PgdA/CDA1 family)/glycosyltransferase involved in cell wall biosynthesis
MDKKAPLVSVVIPACNEEESLPGTLKSLQAQDYPGEYEIVVVDNNSADRTAMLAQEFGARVVVEPRQGVSYARQTGFEAARGEYILSTDADALLPENWVSRIVGEFEKHPEALAVAGAYIFNDGPLFLRTVSRFYELIFRVWNSYAGVNLAVRKEAFNRVGGFNLALDFSEDTDLGRRLTKIGKVVRISSPHVRTSARRYIKLGTLGGMVYYSALYLHTFYFPTIGEVSFEPVSAIDRQHTSPWKIAGRLVAATALSLGTFLFLSVNAAYARFSGITHLARHRIPAAGLAHPRHSLLPHTADLDVLSSASGSHMGLILFGLLVLVLLLLYAVAHPAANLFGKVIHVVDTDNKVLALTFDDGPNPATTPQILAILDEKEVRATFFVVGENARRSPDILQEIYHHGHEIDVHSRTHSPRLLFSGSGRIREELSTTASLITEYTGLTPHYFRPPWGRRSPWMLSEAGKLHLETVTWTVDTRDWLYHSGKKVVRRFERHLSPGAIVLMHDGQGQHHIEMTSTLEALPVIIEWGRDRGYTFMTLDEMLALPSHRARLHRASSLRRGRNFFLGTRSRNQARKA